MKASKNGGFFLCLLINLILNCELAVVAVLLLVLHFILSFPIWLFWICLAIWIGWVLLLTSFISYAAKTSAQKEYRENKNPYSVKSENKFL